MSQTLSAMINIFFSIGILSWTCVKMLDLTKRNIRTSATLWLAEYKAHSCGRALAAIANFHAYAIRAAAKNRQAKALYETTDRYFQERITARYAADFQITAGYCLDLKSLQPIAEVYLRNSDEIKPGSPNYTYRLTGWNFQEGRDPWN